MDQPGVCKRHRICSAPEGHRAKRAKQDEWPGFNRNWLLKEQANELLNAPDPSTLKGKRDHAILAISCGLRRAELVDLESDKIQQREGRWVIPDLVGKGNRLRTVTVPAAVKVRFDVDRSREKFRRQGLPAGEQG